MVGFQTNGTTNECIKIVTLKSTRKRCLYSDWTKKLSQIILIVEPGIELEPQVSPPILCQLGSSLVLE